MIGIGQSGRGSVVVLHRDVRADPLVKPADFFQARRAAVGDDDPRGPIAPSSFCSRCQVTAIAEPPAPSTKASAPVCSQCPSGRKASSASPLVIGSLAWPTSWSPSLEMLLISPISSANGSRRSNWSRQAVQQVDLVRGHQGAERERILPDERHRLAVVLRFVVPPEVHAADDDIAEAEELSPPGKDLHDRGLVRRHADEVHRRLLRGGKGRRVSAEEGRSASVIVVSLRVGSAHCCRHSRSLW